MSTSPFSLPGVGMTLQIPMELREPSKSEDAYCLNELDSQNPKFKEICIDFKNAGLKVIRIEQLDSFLLWQKYVSEKKNVNSRKPQAPNFELNEKYLYHGTSAKKEYICEEGLDARLSKKGGRFGQGIYFSENPLKCVKYAEKNENTSFIVLARVILGCSKNYPKGQMDKLLTREPVKEGSFRGWRFYDSVVGCPKDHKEFVIYRNDRALIECIISYSKDSSANTKSSSAPMASSVCSSTPTSITSSKPVDSFPSGMRNYDGDYDNNSSGTSDEEESSDSSDSDLNGYDKVLAIKKEENHNGHSSDSSAEQDDEDASQFTGNRNKLSHAQLQAREKRGDEILADKKKKFMLKTGENRSHVIESFLSTTGLNVEKAVDLFLNKEKKRHEMEKEQRIREMEKEESSGEETDVYEDAACSIINPHDHPDKWNQLESKDKEAIVDVLVDNFLAVVGLEDNADNRKVGIKVLMSCHYDLDSSILSYYESL